MQTSRLYYDDCYTSMFKAELLEFIPEGRRAYLQATYFYPTSGGQLNDLGSIAGLAVEDVIDEGDRIAHVLAGVPEPGPVSCRVDWGRRYDHMQQHTGQHLLSSVVVELFGFKTLSFHMGQEVSSIEIATAQLDETQIDQIERRANELVSEIRPVRFSYEDAGAAAGLRKVSARTGLLRIVTIEAYDRSACGGTHVRSTAEIGPVQIRDLERVRGNLRLEFVCGIRALRRSKQDFRMLAELARATSVQPQALVEHVAGLRQRLETSEKALAKGNLLLAQGEGARLYEETSALADGTRRRLVAVAGLTDSIRAMALAFAAREGGIIAIVPETVPGTVLLACSTGCGVHAGALWKDAFADGGGRGGGSATLAQGHVTDANSLEKLLASAGIALGNG